MKKNDRGQCWRCWRRSLLSLIACMPTSRCGHFEIVQAAQIETLREKVAELQQQGAAAQARAREQEQQLQGQSRFSPSSLACSLASCFAAAIAYAR